MTRPRRFALDVPEQFAVALGVTAKLFLRSRAGKTVFVVRVRGGSPCCRGPQRFALWLWQREPTLARVLIVQSCPASGSSFLAGPGRWQYSDSVTPDPGGEASTTIADLVTAVRGFLISGRSGRGPHGRAGPVDFVR